MSNIEITVNAEAINDLASDIVKAKKQLIGKLAARGHQILTGQVIGDKSTGEVPYAMGNLREGVKPPNVDYEDLTAELTVTARSAFRGARQADVFDKDGKATGRKVSLRPSPAFNYAESVERGRPSLSPKSGRALLIPLPTAPTGESYLMAGGQVYIVRKSAKAVPPNPYME